MKTVKPSSKTLTLKSLIKMHQKNYGDAIRNNIEFDKIKIIYQTIKELEQLYQKKT